MQPNIFIICPLNRSGSNFLADTLGLVEGYGLPQIREDYFLEHSEMLLDYVSRHERRWGIMKENAVTKGAECLGDGLMRFLQTGCASEETAFICRTPRPYGLKNFFSLFPNDRLVLLVRDGRDTVESAHKSFPYLSRNAWAVEWRNGAREILQFIDSEKAIEKHKQWTLVNYEDLINEPRKTVVKILSLINVAEDDYPWSEMDKLPLRGSSAHRGDKPRVNWESMPKPKDFKPVGRWESWSRWQRFRFDIIAGKELRSLGYT